MNFIKCEKLEKSMAELQFSIDAEAFKGAVADVFKKEGKKYSVPGFRKGKAPRSLIEKMYGADVFTYDAINELFPAAYEAAVKEAGIEPVGRPEVSVDAASETEGVTLTVKVAVMPEVKIGNYNGLTVEKTVHTVTDEAVDAELKRVQERNARELTREGAAENGDIADIDFEGFVDGVAFEGGKAEHYNLTLGSGSFIPGFEDQIVGHMPGETFDVNVTFPDDYQATNLAGKDAVFATTLNYINEDVTPDLTDDWVSSNLAESMGMNNVAELKTFVSNSLLFNQEANELYGQLYDAAEVNTDTLPEDVQQYFTNTVLYQPYLYAQMRGVSLETMLSQAGYSSVDEYLENSESSKQNMIKQILIMQALAEKNNIVCDTDILNAEFSRYFGSTDMTSYVNAYGENYVKTNILHDIVMQNQIDNVA